MKTGIFKKLDINRERLRKTAQQALSPAFILILLGSSLLWYTSKLSYDYNTQMPLTVRIDGQKYKLTAEIEGRGSILMAQKLSLKSKINLKLDELSPRSSEDNPGSFILNERKLLDAINGRVKDLKINRIIDAPEFTPDPLKEKRNEKRAKKRADAEEDVERVPGQTE